VVTRSFLSPNSMMRCVTRASSSGSKDMPKASKFFEILAFP